MCITTEQEARDYVHAHNLERTATSTLIEIIQELTEGNYALEQALYIPSGPGQQDDYEIDPFGTDPDAIAGYKIQIFDQPYYYFPTRREALIEAIFQVVDS